MPVSKTTNSIHHRSNRHQNQQQKRQLFFPAILPGMWHPKWQIQARYFAEDGGPGVGAKGLLWGLHECAGVFLQELLVLQWVYC